MKKDQCPCCGYYTMNGIVPGSFSICPVCFWEDDDTAFRMPDTDVGGANGSISLNEARENFKKYGAIDEGSVKYVRKPLPEEMRE